VKRGSRSTARFTFTVPLRDFQLSMSATKSPGSWFGSTRRRNEITGCAVVITLSAEISVPSTRVTPVVAPSRTTILATGAPVRTGAAAG
jgi:hypothetical protein